MMVGRICSALVVVAVVGLISSAHAQSTSGIPNLTMQGPPESSNSGIIRDAFGRPCLDIEAAARAEVVNPQMMDHVVSIKNNCPRLIKVKVCYFNSDRCNNVDVQAYKRVDTILGTMRGIFYFRYWLTQK